jgi:hypothetical protein
MEGSCEYVEQAVADSRQGAVLHLGGWAGANPPPPPGKKIVTEHHIQPRSRTDSLTLPKRSG